MSHQLLFFKVDEYALLKLYKRYLILSILSITRKSIQQYVNSFKIIKQVNQLAYQFTILVHRIYMPGYFNSLTKT